MPKRRLSGGAPHGHQASGGHHSGGLASLDRRERSLLHEVDRNRSSMKLSEYLTWCRSLCRRVEGLRFDVVRGRVWRDLLLLREASFINPDAMAADVPFPMVPYTSESGCFASSPSSGLAVPPNCHMHVLNCDLQRSMWHHYPSEDVRTKKRELVRDILLRCLSNRPTLHYYQGLHEVVGFVEYTVGSHVPREVLVAMVDQLLAQHLCTFASETLRSTESVLQGMHAAICCQCPQLGQLLESLHLGPENHFALPWVITWFTHHLAETDAKGLARLFDVLLCGTDGLSASASTAPPPGAAAVPQQHTPSAQASSSAAGRDGVSAVRRSLLTSSGSLLGSAVLRLSSSVHGSAAQGQRLSADQPGTLGTAQHLPPAPHSTMVALISVALVAQHAEELMTVVTEELEAVGGDADVAFGRVFTLLAALPVRLMEGSGEVQEAVIARALRMGAGRVPGLTELLRARAAYAAEHRLADVQAEVAQQAKWFSNASSRRISLSLARAALTSILFATVAATTFFSLAGGET